MKTDNPDRQQVRDGVTHIPRRTKFNLDKHDPNNPRFYDQAFYKTPERPVTYADEDDIARMEAAAEKRARRNAKRAQRAKELT